MQSQLTFSFYWPDWGWWTEWVELLTDKPLDSLMPLSLERLVEGGEERGGGAVCF